MWKLILLVIFTLVHKSTQAELSTDSPYANRCGDCGELEKMIYSNTGHFCHPVDKNVLTKNFTQTESKQPKCVPNVYDILWPVRQYCCFWSPQLGCRILTGELFRNSYGSTCTPCIKHCPMARGYGNRPTMSLAMPFLALWQMLILFNQLG